jgi:hypothetical protein
LIVHEAFDPSIRAGILRPMRRWSNEEWAEALTDVRQRGWLTDDETPTLTEEDLRRRHWIEDRTDGLAAVAYDPIGSAGIERMITLGAEVVMDLKTAGLGIGDHVRRFSITDG